MRVGGLEFASAAVVVVGSVLAPPTDRQPTDPPTVVRRAAAAPVAADQSCRVCHPAAVDALAISVHAALLTRPDTEDHACTVCHGDATEHRESARRPESELVPAGPVHAAVCATCHDDGDRSPATAAHPWVRSEDLARAELDGRSPTATPALPAPSGIGAFDWSGLLSLGYRFVSTTGSFDRYVTDVDLRPGLRLVEGRLTGEGNSALLDRVDLRAADVGDPFSRYSAELEKDDLFRARADHRERVFEYRASGDYSRVAHHERVTALALDLDLSESFGVYADLERFRDNGFWLTRRIGDRGSVPLVSTDGVESPRDLESDEFEIGVHGEVSKTSYRVGFEYLDEEYRERWSYDRGLVGPGIVADAEDFRSLSSLTGPGIVGSVSQDFGPVRVEIDGRHRRLDRSVDGAGTRSGFDSTSYITSTTSVATGEAETTWLGAEVIADLSDVATLFVDLRWRDHLEEMQLRQVDTTQFPSAGGSVVVVDERLQRTSQRRLSGSAEIEVEPTAGLIVSAGWGFSREDLRIPDLASGDSDPTGGRIRDDGLIAGAQWRFADGWSLRGRLTDFGQSGLQLYELQERDARTVDGRLRYRDGDLSGEVFVSHRDARNDASSFRSNRTSLGANLSWSDPDATSLFLSYVFSDVDSRTLTSFYFDPDPSPVATVVGFEGETHTAALALELSPVRGLQWRNDLAITRTLGDFDVRTANWRSDLSYEVRAGGQAGLRYELIDYAEDAGIDDYHADLIMVYWTQSIGPARH